MDGLELLENSFVQLQNLQKKVFLKLKFFSNELEILNPILNSNESNVPILPDLFASMFITLRVLLHGLHDQLPIIPEIWVYPLQGHPVLPDRLQVDLETGLVLLRDVVQGQAVLLNSHQADELVLLTFPRCVLDLQSVLRHCEQNHFEGLFQRVRGVLERGSFLLYGGEHHTF